MKLLSDRVAVKLEKTENVTKSGIVISQETENKMIGVVRYVGRGRILEDEFKPLTVQVGDIILVESFAGTNLKYEGEDLLILRERDIMAIVSD